MLDQSSLQYYQKGFSRSASRAAMRSVAQGFVADTRPDAVKELSWGPNRIALSTRLFVSTSATMSAPYRTELRGWLKSFIVVSSIGCVAFIVGILALMDLVLYARVGSSVVPPFAALIFAVAAFLIVTVSMVGLHFLFNHLARVDLERYIPRAI